MENLIVGRSSLVPRGGEGSAGGETRRGWCRGQSISALCWVVQPTQQVALLKKDASFSQVGKNPEFSTPHHT